MWPTSQGCCGKCKNHAQTFDSLYQRTADLAFVKLAIVASPEPQFVRPGKNGCIASFWATRSGWGPFVFPAQVAGGPGALLWWEEIQEGVRRANLDSQAAQQSKAGGSFWKRRG